MATVSAELSSLSLSRCPTRIPTTGATPSQRPKRADVLTDRRKVGLSPPSTRELRKLSRLRIKPSDSSPNTNCSPTGLRVQRVPCDREPMTAPQDLSACTGAGSGRYVLLCLRHHKSR